ncbi:hypothetical protein, partial [Rhizobium lentis]|uniref:hypothetical protein n=1 Tax=Rhizobium lentis TaxID=1138194 RepID=UPI0040555487
MERLRHIPFSPSGSNHVSFLLVLWRPFGFSREDGVGENDEFAGDGYDGAQVILSVLTQAGVERGEIRIVPGCRKRAHEQALSQAFATTLDAASAVIFSAIVVIGCDAGKGGDLGAAG